MKSEDNMYLLKIAQWREKKAKILSKFSLFFTTLIRSLASISYGQKKKKTNIHTNTHITKLMFFF